MRTSKVKVIGNVNEWEGPKGVVYYHDLEMENGDKIQLGKLAPVTVGTELNYEITGDDQYEFRKAKSVNPDYKGGGSGGNSTPQSDDKRQLMIVRQSSLNRALDHLIHQQHDFTKEEVTQLAEFYTNWVMV